MGVCEYLAAHFPAMRIAARQLVRDRVIERPEPAVLKLFLKHGFQYKLSVHPRLDASHDELNHTV